VYYFCEYLAVSLKKYLYNAVQEDGYVISEIVVMSFLPPKFIPQLLGVIYTQKMFFSN